MEVHAPTQAMADIYEHHHTGVEEYVNAFTAADGQSGALFAIDGRIAGMDLFDQPSTLRAMLPKLVRSYAIDAIETAGGDRGRPGPEPARVFLDRVAAADAESYPAVGLGTDIRLSTRGLVGAGLVHDDVLVHLAAFAQAESNHNGPSGDRGVARMSQRRRSFERH